MPKPETQKTKNKKQKTKTKKQKTKNKKQKTKNKKNPDSQGFLRMICSGLEPLTPTLSR